MTYFLNNKTDNEIVNQLIEGFVSAYSHKLERLPNTRTIIRKKIPANKVVILSGGGSGHEPAHIGYVGRNMLDGAIMGNIFEPPQPDEILKAIKATYNGMGTLLIIKNFDKDIYSFLEAERLALAENLKVAHVIVDDDCSIEKATFEKRKRGVAGTLFAHKVIGTAAELGSSVDELVELGRECILRTKTLGVAFSENNSIGNKHKQYALMENEMYFGIGIHGEPGYRKEAMKSSEHIALELTNKLIGQFPRGELREVALIVNGMGSTPLLELSVFLNHVVELLDIEDIHVSFKLLGNFMTSYKTSGLSLTLLNLFDDKLVYLLEAETDAFAWNY